MLGPVIRRYSALLPIQIGRHSGPGRAYIHYSRNDSISVFYNVTIKWVYNTKSSFE